MQISLLTGAVEAEGAPGAASAPAGLFGSVLSSASGQAIATGDEAASPMNAMLFGKMALQMTDIEKPAAAGALVPKGELAEALAVAKTAEVAEASGKDPVSTQTGEALFAKADEKLAAKAGEMTKGAAELLTAATLTSSAEAGVSAVAAHPPAVEELAAREVETPDTELAATIDPALETGEAIKADKSVQQALAANGTETAKPLSAQAVQPEQPADPAEAPESDNDAASGNTAKPDRQATSAGASMAVANGAAPASQPDTKFAGQLDGAQANAALDTPLPSRAFDAGAASQAFDIHHEPRVSARAGRLSHEFSVEITKRINAGATELTVRLDPAELGRVEVKLGFDEGGALRAVVAAESPAALELLRRETGELARALADAGVRTDANSFSFGRERSGQDQHGGWQGQRGESAKDDPFAPPPETLQPELRVAAGRIDILA